MFVVLTGVITMAFLIYTVSIGGFIGYPLLGGLVLFSLLAYSQGHQTLQILGFQKRGALKALVVLRVFAFIGGITGTWLVSGTVAALISLGLKSLHPQWFILFSFLIPAGVSFLLGTSFGTISTIGVALMLIGRGAGLPEALVAGAIISGAYFGDRNSPMSSSANLVAALTETDLHQNVKLMFKSALVPLLLSLLFFAGMSIQHPLASTGLPILQDLEGTFNLNWTTLLPAIVMLLMALSRIDVKVAMGTSILVAIGVALFTQGANGLEVIKNAIFGYALPLDHPLANLLKGGGLVSMLKPAVIVTTACALAGLLEGTRMLEPLEHRLSQLKKPRARFSGTLGTSLVSAAFGSNQTIAIVFTEQLMDKAYGQDRQPLAIAIENSAVLMAALVPWNIAALVPTTTLGVSTTGFIPFAVFLYLVPLYHWLRQPNS